MANRTSRALSHWPQLSTEGHSYVQQAGRWERMCPATGLHLPSRHRRLPVVVAGGECPARGSLACGGPAHLAASPVDTYSHCHCHKGLSVPGEDDPAVWHLHHAPPAAAARAVYMRQAHRVRVPPTRRQAHWHALKPLAGCWSYGLLASFSARCLIVSHCSRSNRRRGDSDSMSRTVTATFPFNSASESIVVAP